VDRAELDAQTRFSEGRLNSKLVSCVLRPPYSNTCARQHLGYFESTFSEKFAFCGTERVKYITKDVETTDIVHCV